MRDAEAASIDGLAPAQAEAEAWVPEPGAAYFPLKFTSETPAKAGKRSQRGVALGKEQVYWNDGAEAVRNYRHVSRISLSLYDKAEGDGGFCGITFADGLYLTVISGLHAGERVGDYDAFLLDLHAHLSPADRLRIVFQDGMPVPNSGIIIGTVVVSAVGFAPAIIAAGLGHPGAIPALVFGIVAGGATALGLLNAQGRTERRRYDPNALPAHTLSGTPRTGTTDRR